MNAQNQIKRTLSAATQLEYVCALLERNEIVHRSELATWVCEQFGFYDNRGKEQRSGWLKVLRELEAAGHFTLPAPCRSPGHRSARRLSEPVALPQEVPSQVGEVQGLELMLRNNCTNQ